MINRELSKPPFLTAIVEYNGDKAFENANIPKRLYPLFLPVPCSVIAKKKSLEIREWQMDLKVHAELVLTVGRDIGIGEGSKARDGVLGYSIGIGVHDNSQIESCDNPSPRDMQINKWYGYFIEGSRIQSEQLKLVDEFSDIPEFSMKMSISHFGVKKYNLKDAIFDGPEMLEQMSKITSFKRGDVICLGPFAEQIKIPKEYRFHEGDIIRVCAEGFEELIIPIDDKRNPIL